MHLFNTDTGSFPISSSGNKPLFFHAVLQQQGTALECSVSQKHDGNLVSDVTLYIIYVYKHNPKDQTIFTGILICTMHGNT